MEVWKKNLLVCWFGVFATSTGLSQLAPVLPLFIEELGIHEIDAIQLWSGIIFGVTFICMAIFSPVWGRAADKYGRKPMLLRASFGMAVIITAMSFVQNVYQLAGLRLLQGTISGFYAASITLIAVQTPREQSGWALGTLSTAALSGMLAGPLMGGYLTELFGVRSVFLATGFLVSIAFVASVLFVRENFVPATDRTVALNQGWTLLPNSRVIVALFVTTLVLQLAVMSIQPIITVYIAALTGQEGRVALLSGMVFAAAGLASILAAPRLGRLSDTIGPHKVILAGLIAAGILFIPQAYVSNVWQLMGLRFLVGIATAGLLPAINSLLKQITPDEIAGRMFGYNQSAQFLGSFTGAVMGGGVAAYFGIHYVFFITAGLLLLNALWVHKTVYAMTADKSGS